MKRPTQRTLSLSSSSFLLFADPCSPDKRVRSRRIPTLPALSSPNLGAGPANTATRRARSSYIEPPVHSSSLADVTLPVDRRATLPVVPATCCIYSRSQSQRRESAPRSRRPAYIFSGLLQGPRASDGADRCTDATREARRRKANGGYASPIVFVADDDGDDPPTQPAQSSCAALRQSVTGRVLAPEYSTGGTGRGPARRQSRAHRAYTSFSRALHHTRASQARAPPRRRQPPRLFCVSSNPLPRTRFAISEHVSLPLGSCARTHHAGPRRVTETYSTARGFQTRARR
ncbi:hypothetical protein BC834DRAFT_492060 [Gloeopeniophorella convolvens]|nr:hypothetical protein BC834DRAFT_492060 [Gloeopeniophorella convolvens]